MTKERISTNVDHPLAQQIEVAANELKMNKLAWLAEAAKAELERLDARLLIEQSHQEVEAAKQLRDDARNAHAESEKECDVAQEPLKAVASHLGVPDTAHHCKQRIDEIETQAKIDSDKIAIVTDERDTARAERDAFKAQRDAFKAERDRANKTVAVGQERIRWLIDRSWWARLWNVIPWGDPH